MQCCCSSAKSGRNFGSKICDGTTRGSTVGEAFDQERQGHETAVRRVIVKFVGQGRCGIRNGCVRNGAEQVQVRRQLLTERSRGECNAASFGVPHDDPVATDLRIEFARCNRDVAHVAGEGRSDHVRMDPGRAVPFVIGLRDRVAALHERIQHSVFEAQLGPSRRCALRRVADRAVRPTDQRPPVRRRGALGNRKRTRDRY